MALGNVLDRETTMNFRRKALRYLIMGWIVCAVFWLFACVFVLTPYMVYIAYVERTRTEIPVIECNLPCRCKHLLGTSTWAWAECMQVGRK